MPIAKLLQYTHDIIACFDPQGLVTEVNQTFLELLGYQSSEIVGKHIQDLVAVSGRQLLQACWDNAVRGVPVDGCELSLLCSDGSQLDVQMRLVDAPSQGEGAMCGFFRSLPGDRRASEKWRASEHQLRTALAAAWQQVRLRQQQQQRLLALQERQLGLVADEIHDSFVQYAVGAQMWLQAGEEGLSQVDSELSTSVVTARESIAQAIADARRMIRKLRPLNVDAQGIVGAIGGLIAAAEQDVDTHFAFICERRPGRFGAVLEEQLFRVVQETLANIIRHSKARHATVGLKKDEGWVAVEVADDGVGFDPAAVPTDRFGLASLRMRTEVLGGELTVTSQPYQGTRVSVRLPALKE